jgi:hypothetical protein
MFRPTNAQQLAQSLFARGSVLPLQLHQHLAANPSSKSYQDVVGRLTREINAFCSEIRELISWWKSDVPSPLAHSDIDQLVEQGHAAFDNIDRLVPGGRGQDEHENDYQDDEYGRYAAQGDDQQQSLDYISAYINAMARTFRVMTDTFRIAEMMLDDR